MNRTKATALASAVATTLGAGDAEATTYTAALTSVTRYATPGLPGSGPGNVSSSTATWSYDSNTDLVTQMGGTFNVRFTGAPVSTLFRHSVTGLVIGAGAAATASTFICTEGNFGSGSGASLCGNYSFGNNFYNESQVTYGPGTATARTMGGDDEVVGPQQSVADLNGFSTVNWVGTTLTLSNARYTWVFTTGAAIPPPPPPPVWAPPGVGVTDLATTTRGVAKDVYVLANDLDFGSPATVTMVSGPANGTVVISGSPGNGGSVKATYTPTAGFSGTDSFTYSVTDGVSSSTAPVTVTVLADTDLDGKPDLEDNCRLLANTSQCDSDADGYGNRCDGDLGPGAGNGFTNAQDNTLFKAQLGQPSVAPVFNKADINCNGFVNAQDNTLFKALLGTGPGPSAKRGPSNSYLVTGTVSELIGSGLVLRNNGGDNLSVPANGPFVFATGLAGGAAYAVTVLTQPTNPSQTCAVSSGSGTVGPGTSPAVVLNCTRNSFTVGGTVSGLIGSGLSLQNKAASTAPVAGNGAFAFPAPLVSGAKYEVKATAQPAGPNQTCTPQSATGTVAAGNITSVSVPCAVNGTYYYAANYNSSTLSIYRVQAAANNTYSYTFVGTTATPAGPTSVDTDSLNRYAYVTSSGTDALLVYTINAGTGALTLVNSYPAGDFPAEVQISPNGATAWVSSSGAIASFHINGDGTLAPIGSPVTSVYGAIEHYPDIYEPLFGHEHVVVWGSGSCPQGTCGPPLWQYAVNPNGTLNYEGWFWWSGPTEPTDPPHQVQITIDEECDPRTANQQHSYYVANPGANTISLYGGDYTCVDGQLSLQLVGTFPAGPEPRAIAVNAAQTFAYVINGGNNTLSTFAVSAGGNLTPVGTLVPTGPDPSSLALDPGGSVLYVVNAGDNTVSYYSLNPTTGQPTLTNVQ